MRLIRYDADTRGQTPPALLSPLGLQPMKKPARDALPRHDEPPAIDAPDRPLFDQIELLRITQNRRASRLDLDEPDYFNE